MEGVEIRYLGKKPKVKMSFPWDPTGQIYQFSMKNPIQTVPDAVAARLVGEGPKAFEYVAPSAVVEQSPIAPMEKEEDEDDFKRDPNFKPEEQDPGYLEVDASGEEGANDEIPPQGEPDRTSQFGVGDQNDFPSNDQSKGPKPDLSSKDKPAEKKEPKRRGRKPKRKYTKTYGE